MSAVIGLKGMRPRVWQDETTGEQNREPRLCWRELVQLAMDGVSPTDQRLEHLLDRIERMP